MPRYLKKYCLLLVLLLSNCFELLAISSPIYALDTLVTLKEFSVEANRYTQQNPGQKTENIDSTFIQAPIAQNLSDLLSQNNSFFIKSYGLGSLSTGSFRGSSASQTSVLWNGFNLQSPMYGMLDYALVPALFLDDVSLNYGGTAALFGSGSVGGTLLLTNRARFNTGFKISVSGSFGSFENYQQSAKVQWSNKKICVKASAFNHRAKNNYPFINTAEISRPLQIQQNAQLNQSGVLLENYFQLRKTQAVSLRFWYQSTNRQIPSAITSVPTQQNQLDEFYRISADWSHKTRANQFIFRCAYFDERLNFNYPEIKLYSYSRSKTVITELEDSYFFKENLYLTAGINATYISALSDGYKYRAPMQSRVSGFASLHYNSKDKSWKNTISLRKEFYGKNQIPLTATLGSEKLFFKLVKLRTSASRNYRIPTFNDLYWNEQGAAGNANLLPESGWSGDFGVGAIDSKNNYDVDGEVCIFDSEVKNMIVWQPGLGGIWSPQNVSSVWSRGAEAQLGLKIKLQQVALQLKGKYSFTKSTDNTKSSSRSTTYGKQIFYVPMSNYQAESSILVKGFKLSYQHIYTGKRFTNNENTEYLKAFKTGNASLSKTVLVKKMSLGIFIQVNNIWDEQYQAIAWRPMPMRNYQVGLTLGFN